MTGKRRRRTNLRVNVNAGPMQYVRPVSAGKLVIVVALVFFACVVIGCAVGSTVRG